MKFVEICPIPRCVKALYYSLHVRPVRNFSPRSPGPTSAHCAQPGLSLYGIMRLAHFLLRRQPSLVLQPVRDPGCRGTPSRQGQRETAPSAVVSTKV